VAQEILDTVVSSETPEGIAIELRPAGLSARCYAFLIDQLVRLVLFWIIMLPLAVSERFDTFQTGIVLIALFLLEWLYPVVFELSPWGATPGKRIFGLRVVMDSGLPVTPGASLTRNLLRVADFLPFCYGFAIVSMLLRRDFKRLGDIAADTLVVYRPQPAPKATWADDIEPIPPARPLQLHEQAAIVALSARAKRMTPERLDELAALAAWVSGDQGQRGPHVTKRVLAVAQWLLGKRS
jgi:uncharacterized RDD family membrane protein YckC